ncbi:hypothetical protein Cadr_000022468 [Camelus dromedarius]|uniref:Uncharacterized protein n=1 Tax=Camelus dromedarius TaxID=9838 RepID=A0A5N4CT95_CAMDR|nr:hypothetical protein Cadr_000022468 [Camelus dromedarius]
MDKAGVDTTISPESILGRAAPGTSCPFPDAIQHFLHSLNTSAEWEGLSLFQKLTRHSAAVSLNLKHRAKPFPDTQIYWTTVHTSSSAPCSLSITCLSVISFPEGPTSEQTVTQAGEALPSQGRQFPREAAVRKKAAFPSRRQQTWCQIRHQDGRLHPHMMGGEGAPWGLVDKGTNPITGLPLTTSSLSKGPPSNTITLEVRISTQLLELGAWEMGGEPQPLRGFQTNGSLLLLIRNAFPSTFTKSLPPRWACLPCSTLWKTACPVSQVLGDRKGSEPASALQDRRRPALRDSKMTDGHICPHIKASGSQPWLNVTITWEAPQMVLSDCCVGLTFSLDGEPLLWTDSSQIPALLTPSSQTASPTARVVELGLEFHEIASSHLRWSRIWDVGTGRDNHSSSRYLHHRANSGLPHGSAGMNWQWATCMGTETWRGPSDVRRRQWASPLMLFKDITMGPRTRAHDYLDVGRTGIQVFLKGQGREPAGYGNQTLPSASYHNLATATGTQVQMDADRTSEPGPLLRRARREGGLRGREELQLPDRQVRVHVPVHRQPAVCPCHRRYKGTHLCTRRTQLIHDFSKSRSCVTTSLFPRPVTNVSYGQLPCLTLTKTELTNLNVREEELTASAPPAGKIVAQQRAKKESRPEHTHTCSFQRPTAQVQIPVSPLPEVTPSTLQSLHLSDGGSATFLEVLEETKVQSTTCTFSTSGFIPLARPMFCSLVIKHVLRTLSCLVCCSSLSDPGLPPPDQASKGSTMTHKPIKQRQKTPGKEEAPQSTCHTRLSAAPPDRGSFFPEGPDHGCPDPGPAGCGPTQRTGCGAATGKLPEQPANLLLWTPAASSPNWPCRFSPEAQQTLLPQRHPPPPPTATEPRQTWNQSNPDNRRTPPPGRGRQDAGTTTPDFGRASDTRVCTLTPTSQTSTKQAAHTSGLHLLSTVVT